MWRVSDKNIKLILIWGFAMAALSFSATLFFPKQYKAVSQILVISRDRAGVDPYTQARSAEKIGTNLTQVMKTTDFFNKVIGSTAYPFDVESWKNLNNYQRRKKWAKDVSGSMVYGTSIMNITVYGYNREEAGNLSGAVTQTLVARGWEYLGGDVAIKAVSTPLISRWPVRPNLFINLIVGFLVGISISGLWVLKFKQRHLFG
jgi:capsular polysaccharide biosynthesis protein